MNTSFSANPPRISPAARTWAATLGAAPLVLLAVAATLTPSPTGVGTHRQLGFPPCTFQTIFAQRCPACGMTTSWAHLTRGHFVAALQANVGGVALALAAGAGGLWLVASAVRGRWLGRFPTDIELLAASAIVVTITLVDWGWRFAQQ